MPPDRDEESTRRFSSFTGDPYALADWLGRCRIQSVAMESTGVYWIPLFQSVGKRGFKVYWVNAHYQSAPQCRWSGRNCIQICIQLSIYQIVSHCISVRYNGGGGGS